MKQFMEPEVKLEKFRVEDVITTSSDESVEPPIGCAIESPIG